MRKQLLLGASLVFLTVLLHAAVIVLLAQALSGAAVAGLIGQGVSRFLALGIAVLVLVGVHFLEAFLWAFVYLRIGEFDDIDTALYFSVVTTTTLGYGDITLNPAWRVLASVQAVGGLILFGASTAFLFEVLQALTQS